jgi:hypothetical protein
MKVIKMSSVRYLAFVAGVLFVLSPAVRAQIGQRCPRSSLSDTSYPDVVAVKEFLAKQGYMVRCVTSSKMNGTAGLTSVAGFQADQGTFTVFFLPRGEKVKVTETALSHGYYRYAFVRKRPGQKPVRYAYRTNGQEYYLQHDDWLILVWDAGIADQLRNAK